MHSCAFDLLENTWSENLKWKTNIKNQNGERKDIFDVRKASAVDCDIIELMSSLFDVSNDC